MQSEPECVFCKIVAGQIPCHRVWENEAILAFLDINPLAPGHLLVVTKSHHATLAEVPPPEAEILGASLPALVRSVREAMDASGVNVLQNNGRAAGQVVQHVHVHLIPRREGDGLGYRWNVQTYGPGEAEAVLTRLAAHLPPQ